MQVIDEDELIIQQAQDSEHPLDLMVSDRFTRKQSDEQTLIAQNTTEEMRDRQREGGTAASHSNSGTLLIEPQDHVGKNVMIGKEFYRGVIMDTGGDNFGDSQSNAPHVSQPLEVVQSAISSASPAASVGPAIVAAGRLACLSALRDMSDELNALSIFSKSGASIRGRHSSIAVNETTSSPLLQLPDVVVLCTRPCDEATSVFDASPSNGGSTVCGVVSQLSSQSPPTCALQQVGLSLDCDFKEIDGEVDEVPFQPAGKSKRRNRRKPKFLESYDIRI